MLSAFQTCGSYRTETELLAMLSMCLLSELLMICKPYNVAVRDHCVLSHCTGSQCTRSVWILCGEYWQANALSGCCSRDAIGQNDHTSL